MKKFKSNDFVELPVGVAIVSTVVSGVSIVTTIQGRGFGLRLCVYSSSESYEQDLQ